MINAFPINNRFSLSTFQSSFYSSGVLNRIRAVLEVRKHNADINHVTGDTNFLVLGLPRKNTILTIHDCGFLETKKNIFSRWVLKTFWIDLPVKNCEIITSVSEATKQDIIRLTGCSGDKIVVIPTVTNSTFVFHPKKFCKEKPIILHIGNAPNKNFERHAKAIEDLRCHFHIIGKMSESQVTLLKNLNIDYSISYNLSVEEMQEAFQAADILLFCSTLEGFGMPILEAQKIGRVVVTSLKSSMPEVAGKAACFADPLNISDIRRAIDKVITDDIYRNDLIEAGVENVKRFNPIQVAQQYMELYKRIVGIEKN